MKLPYAVYTERKTKKYTIGFKGLNRTPTVNEGELTTTKNVSAGYLPCLTLRASREVVATLTDGQALFASPEKLCWVDDTNFVYDGEIS